MVPFILTFSISLGLSFTIALLATRPAAANRSAQQRLISIQQPQQSPKREVNLEKKEQPDYASWLGSFLDQSHLSCTLKTLLLQADSSTSIGAATLISAGCGLVCGLAVLMLLNMLWLALCALSAGVLVPFGILRFRRSRRVKAFNSALPDAVDLMARALRAGHSVSSSMELMSEQSPEPLAGEFAQVFQQQKFGLHMRDALLQMARRLPSRDLQFLVTAILVQKETGGDLTEILERTSQVIRERGRIEGEVRTRTAQGRLTGWILALLPGIMLLLINVLCPEYSNILFHDPAGKKMLYAGAILIVIGSLVIRKIVDVEV